MRRTTSTMIVCGALFAMGALDGTAQDVQSQRRGPRAGPDTEAIMQMRDRLELTEAQIAELDAIRREAVARRSTEMAEMAEMRSQLRAGQIRRSELMAFQEDRREANAGLVDERRARIESVLTEQQLEALEDMRARTRAFARGSQSARRGPRGAVGPWGRDGVRRPGPPRFGDRPGPRGPRQGPREELRPDTGSVPPGSPTPRSEIEPVF